jgi:aminoglycoside phosphotransferase (APT) family kinase protein
VPAFVGEAVRRLLTEDPPPAERAVVVSHNDVNPSNFVYDGENLLLLDWNIAAPNDPLYDLATVSVFLRMDDETCRRLLAAYDGAPVSGLSPRFAYNRRLVAVLCGTSFLHLARHGGHAGANGGETLESTASLGDFYQRMRAGAVSLAAADGQWAFGLALVKAGAEL